MAPAVVLEKAVDAPNRFGEIVGVRQENKAEVIGRRPVETGALHDQHFLLGEQGLMNKARYRAELERLNAKYEL